MTQELEILQGAISAVVYQNYDNGYAVLRLSVGGGQTVTVVGTIPMPSVGERLMVTGKWSTHSSYGRQFEAEFLERLMPQTSMEILGYLSSRVIKGIGPRMAARIVDRFGDQTLVIMEREPERLAEVSGISREKAKTIGEEFRLQVGMRHLMEFFAMHQLSAELAVRPYKLYGDSTIELLYDDPYLLMEDGLEAPFSAVDKFAIELGVAGDDPRRVEAGILFELTYNLGAGHSFLPLDKLVAATSQLISVDAQTVAEGMNRLLEADRLVKDTLNGIEVVYLPRLHEAETYCTSRLLSFAKAHFPEPMGLDRMIRKVAKQMNIPDWLAWPFVVIGAKVYGGFDIRETDAAQAVKNAQVPILIIHGEADGFVPCEMSDIAAHNPEMVVRHTFSGADHGISYLADTPRYQKLVTEFMQKVLR